MKSVKELQEGSKLIIIEEENEKRKRHRIEEGREAAEVPIVKKEKKEMEEKKEGKPVVKKKKRTVSKTETIRAEIKKRAGGFGRIKTTLTLRDVIQAKYCSRTEVTKLLWDYIKANNLQDPSNRKMILCDEKLKKIFQCDSIHMFKMSKALSEVMIYMYIQYIDYFLRRMY